ncbi:hypothetical protein V6N13_047866 [Hibiscus sabdariffa]|uniref:mitogen-activated protein kinase kinase kinase n=1 Tax=Hibiscus sabdariffa TaxID=183260 RepID=A0ABR2F5G3_9ROSI
MARKNNTHSMEKTKGFPVTKRSPRNSYDNEAYPLPQPSASCRSSMESNRRGSSSSSNESFDDDDLHGDFSSFRVFEENNSNLWSKGLDSGSKAWFIHQSARGLSPWDARFESPSEKHPRHPLPLPPSSTNGPPKKPPSKWKKGKLLGRGTFGHVYAGFNSENGTMCAVKEVKVITDDQTSKECLKQLNQEISLLSELSHPNIVQYYGSELGSDKLSVYLEYVSGGSIHKLLGEYGSFKEPVIQSYTRQILSGLAYLHGGNTVHRDIKGANILVDPNGGIKLADFGMAKHISCSSMLSFKGSPYWMAPEVIMNTNGYSLAVDIWSLGCTVLEMATSKPPWSQYEGVAAIFKIANSKGFPEIPNNLSKDAQTFIKLCLQRDPTARPTALQLLQHPFIQDQSMMEPTKFNLVNEASLTSFHESQYMQADSVSEFRSNRLRIPTHGSDHRMQQTSRRPSKDSWDEISITSPESPCSYSIQQCKSVCGSSLQSSYQPSY